MATGVAGIPGEYFNPFWRDRLARRWQCGPSLTEYAAALRARRTGANGVFGVKLHWNHAAALADELQRETGVSLDTVGAILHLIPNALFVRIIRLDVDAQAVSLWIGLHTTEWVRYDGQDGRHIKRVPYSRKGLEWCRYFVVDGDAMWRRALLGDPTWARVLTYERLGQDYESELLGVLATLRAARPEPRIELPEKIDPPQSQKQADRQAQLLLERFRSEHQRKPPGPPRAARLRWEITRRLMSTPS